MDQYALLHLATHLYRARRYEELYALLEDRAWYEKHQVFDPSHVTYVAHIELAIQAAESKGNIGMPEVMAYSLLYATIRSISSRVPVDVLKVLAMFGEQEQALRRAHIALDLTSRIEAYQQIGLALWNQGLIASCRTAMSKALDAIAEIGSSREKAICLVTLAGRLASIEAEDLANEAFSLALSTVEQLDNNDRDKPRLLATLATSLAKTGAKAQAKTLLEKAVVAATRVKAGRERAGALSAIAQIVKTAPEDIRPERALREIIGAFESMGKDKLLSGAFADIAAAVAETRDSEGLVWLWSHAWAAQLKQYPDTTLCTLATALCRAGDPTRALDVAARIEGSYQKAEVLCTLAKILAEDGDTAGVYRALAIAETIARPEDVRRAIDHWQRQRDRPDGIWLEVNGVDRSDQGIDFSVTMDKAEALSGIAAAFGQLNNKTGLLRILDAAVKLRWGTARCQALLATAAALIRLGEAKQAEKVLIKAWNSGWQREDGGWAAEVLGYGAIALAQVGAHAEALRAIQEIDSINKRFLATEQISQLYESRDNALIALISSVIQDGSSTERLGRALEIAGMIRSSEVKASALSDIAVAWSGMKESREAREGLMRVFDVAGRIEVGEYKIRAFCSVAKAFAEIREVELAIEAFSRAIITAHDTDSARDKAKQLSTITTGLVRVPDRQSVRMLLPRLLTLAEEAPTDQTASRAKALCAISTALMPVDPQQARAALARAVAVANEITRVDSRAEALSSIVPILVAFGDRAGLFHALEMADALEWPDYRAMALSTVAVALAQVGEYAQGLAVAEKIDHNSATKVKTLSSIARTMAERGENRREAAAAVSRALTAAEEISFLNYKWRAGATTYRPMAKYPLIYEASTDKAAREWAKDRREALITIARVLVETGERRRPRQILSLAAGSFSAIAAALSEPAGSFSRVAAALYKLGQSSREPTIALTGTGTSRWYEKILRSLNDFLLAPMTTLVRRRMARSAVQAKQTPEPAGMRSIQTTFRYTRMQGPETVWTEINDCFPILTVLGGEDAAMIGWERLQRVERLVGG